MDTASPVPSRGHSLAIDSVGARCHWLYEPELGRMPHGGSEFGTFMYGVVVWSDREQGTSA